MFAQSNTVDEVEVCFKYLIRCVAVEYFDKQCDNSFNDESVTFGSEMKSAFCVAFTNQPQAALAAGNKVAYCNMVFADRHKEEHDG